MAPAGAPPTSVRVDLWAWSVRLYKTRSAATDAAKAGHIRVNGDRAKPAQPVKVGDEVRALTDREHIVFVKQLLTKRVGAAIAAAAVDDRTPALPPKEERVAPVVRERGAGRPTKRDRRAIERLRGH
jgi:ribosome-associated heat shock protein Hsp15